MDTVWIEVVKQLPFAGAIIWVVFQLLKGFAAERTAMMEFYNQQEMRRADLVKERDDKMRDVINRNSDSIDKNSTILGEAIATMRLLKISLNVDGPQD